MALEQETRERIEKLIGSNPVMVFMKGNRDMPQCGFSAKVVRTLDRLLPEYGTFDVLEDNSVREGIKEYSSWPTIPQLYIRGELIGGSDIVLELFSSGELQQKLGVETPEAKEPTVHITEEAAQGLGEVRERMQVPEGYELRLMIDARGKRELGFTDREENDFVVETGGVRILVDPMSAARADGVTIAVAETNMGRTFRVEGP